MNRLAEYIREGIEQRGHRYVFDNRLDEVWPLPETGDRTAQIEAIAQFAKEYGWSVSFIRGGKIAVFRRPKARRSQPKAPSEPPPQL